MGKIQFARGYWALFWRSGLWFLAAILLALGIARSEISISGAMIHGRLIANSVAVLVLIGIVSGVIALFHSGWVRLGPDGYGWRLPWRGVREDISWNDIQFIALVPGPMAGNNQQVSLLLVKKDGQNHCLEYRQGLLKTILAAHPSMRVAALVENRKVSQLCRSLDKEEIGWLPLSWVQHIDGTGELVLRQKIL
jgi:hypothetical protein